MASNLEPTPLISIVVPSFNQSSFLQQTLDSILEQSYPRLELIVIDGGSTDDTLQILRDYDAYLSYWCSEPDGGHANALLKGFQKSSGEIMAWLNSDDMYFPWTLDVVASLFVQFPQVNWITGRGVLRNEKGVPTREAHDRKNHFSFLIGDYGWIQQESTFWTRQLWDMANVDISDSLSQPISMVDSAVWCSFFKYAYLYNVDAFLGSYRQHLLNRAEIDPSRCIAETGMFVSKTLLPHYSRLRSVVVFYRALRQILSLYPIRIITNTSTIQSAFARLLAPPEFRIIKFDRVLQRWVLAKEQFFFKPYRPHGLFELFRYGLSFCRLIVSVLSSSIKNAHC